MTTRLKKQLAEELNLDVSTSLVAYTPEPTRPYGRADTVERRCFVDAMNRASEAAAGAVGMSVVLTQDDSVLTVQCSNAISIKRTGGGSSDRS